MAVLEMKLTIKDTINQPTLRSVFKGELGTLAFSLCQTLVSRFADSFGFSTKMTDMQVETITVDTLEHFGYESLQDIILFLKMARSGKFGATNRGIDSNLIFGQWYPIYMEKKALAREDEYVNNKNLRNSTETTIDDVVATYQKEKQNKKQKIKTIEAHVEGITKTMDRQMLEDTIVDWSKDPIKNPYIDILKRKRKTITYD